MHFCFRGKRKKIFYLEITINKITIKGKFIMITIKDNQHIILTATGVPDGLGAATDLLSVTAESSDTSILSVAVVGNAITVAPAVPAKAGTASVTISATDADSNKLADVVTAVTVIAQDATAFVVTAGEPISI